MTHVSLTCVLACTAQAFGFSPAVMHRPARTEDEAPARQAAWLLAHELTGHEVGSIGRITGAGDDDAVIDGIAAACARCDRDADYAELVEFGLPVYSRGLSALTTRRLNLGGSIGEPIVCGGVRVANGDYVLADADGVLVIPPSAVQAIIERGEAASQREQETLALLKSGKTFDEIDAKRRGT